MQQKHWKINGIEVFDRGDTRPFGFEGYDEISIVSMTLHVMKEIKWVGEVYLYNGEKSFVLILRVKDDFDMRYVGEIVKEGVIQIKEHIKYTGLQVEGSIGVSRWNVLLGARDNRFISITYYIKRVW